MFDERFGVSMTRLTLLGAALLWPLTSETEIPEAVLSRPSERFGGRACRCAHGACTGRAAKRDVLELLADALLDPAEDEAVGTHNATVDYPHCFGRP